ncbi:peptidylprolyl isomerase [Roseovarius nanhaiticus]|uniref:Parvulin-like PPIase n=1 Tax=Roseovarius nanhaiticus TaxID=573024 RepID=A0A1N7EJF9_9RHOB|nr:peptidylprolyl isomerase [Roseovarius nanhaiticus]SEK73375.1 peptidyl-prolyl cis-trans isomerase C [Roseovarius nanhaiticus]SIR88250.1 peptidyl-prolyl cis-trans isomerase C [Roseovarius nanhaiticus]
MLDRIKPIATCAMLMGALGTAPVYAQDTASEDAPTADTVVATVDGTEITLGHMLILRAGLPQQFQQVPADVLFPGILDQLIQQTLLADAYEGELPRRSALALENERRALIASEEMAAIAETAVSDEAIQTYFDENYGNAEPATEYNAAHILVETEEEAQALAEEARGDTDFAALAEEHSTGPSGPSGGALGWFSEGMMVEPFQEAVEGMEAGAISDPVQTQFGWHVIKLIETRTQDAPELEQVRDEIVEALRQQAIEERVTELQESGEIDREAGDALDPAVLNQLDLLEE